MKKIALIFLSAFVTVVITIIIFSQPANTKYWNSFSEKQLKNINTISFDLNIHWKTPYIDTAFAPCSISIDKNCIIINEGGYCYTKVTKDSFWVIDNGYANISYGPKEYNWEGCNRFAQLYSRHSQGIDVYTPFYHNPGSTRYNGDIKAMKDSAEFTILTSELLTGYRFDDSTQDYSIPVIETIKTYCDNNSGWIPRVDVFLPLDSVEYNYYFTNISTSGKAHLYDSVFNLSRREYAQYSYYNLANIFAPSEGIMPEKPRDTVFNDNIANIPLAGADGDTVYLRDDKGWILLEFWSYGCKPCTEFLQTMQNEKETLGYRRLEKEGINIYCINIQGGVTDRMIQYAKMFDAEDIVYSSRQMIALDFNFTPTYYLFAPNRDLVYRGYDKDITNLLIKAKQKYSYRNRNN